MRLHMHKTGVPVCLTSTSRSGYPPFSNQYLQPRVSTTFGKFIRVSGTGVPWIWKLGTVGCVIQLLIQTVHYS